MKWKTQCEYCGHIGTWPDDLETRKDKIVCRDTRACDEREASSHRDYLGDLRKRARAGDELTEAERQELNG